MDPRLLQLSDSAFPTGAFVHSFGLEALWHLEAVRSEKQLSTRLHELTWHTAHSGLPFLNDAYDGRAVAADQACEAFLSNHVANRASKAQGRAFLLAAEATFAAPALTALRESLPCAHASVSMGAALSAVAIPRADARRLFLFGAVRGAASAAVRLGIVGPLRAQRVLLELHPVIDAALEETTSLGPDDAATTAPVLELAQAAHDRLYSRLFQS